LYFLCVFTCTEVQGVTSATHTHTNKYSIHVLTVLEHLSSCTVIYINKTDTNIH